MPSNTLAYFKDSFNDYGKRWILANAKFDCHMLENYGTPLKGHLIDVAVMHALLYEEESHGLKDMARTLLGWKWTDFTDTFGSLRARTCICGGTEASHNNKAGFCKKTGCSNFMQSTPLYLLRKAEETNINLLVDYAANDAYGTWHVFKKLEDELQKALTWSLYGDTYHHIKTMRDYFYATEVPFTRTLYVCERNGMKVDKSYLEGLKPTILKEMEDLRFQINSHAGMLLNPKSPDQLIEYFCTRNGVRPRKMTSGGKSGKKKPSIDEKFLEYVADEHLGTDVGKTAALVLEHNKVQKQFGTYIEKMPDRLDQNDRVHPRLNQDVARCMPAGELVLTSRGYLAVEQVRVGDKVISHTGKPRAVIETSTHSPKPIYLCHLSNGLTLRTTGNHQYYTNGDWKRADDLQRGDIVTVHSGVETWVRIQGWPAEVSSWGRVRSTTTGRLFALRPKGRWGHLKVTLTRNGAQLRGADKKDFTVHQLVLKAFAIAHKGTGPEVRHLNGIAWDNTRENLAYGTSHDNRQDALRHGTMSQRRAGRTPLSEQDVAAIRAAKRAGQPPSSTSKLSYTLAERIRKNYKGAAGEITALAKKHDVSIAAMRALLKGKTWGRNSTDSSLMTAKMLAKKYRVSEGTIRDIWANRCWQPEDYIEGVQATFSTAQVVDVTVEATEVTYGLTVEEDCSHVTGGIVTHNTGRLSSSDPNLQNVTGGEKDRFKLRNAFIAEKGCSLVVADYSALEMRLLAAGSQEQAMMDIFHRNWDIHMGNASLVFEIPYEDLVTAKKTDKQVKDGKLPESAMTDYVLYCLKARGDAKTIGFGLNYGMKEKTLARRMGCSEEEAILKINKYMETYPAVRRFFESEAEMAEQTGYSFTLMGRRRHLPDMRSPDNYTRFRAQRQSSNFPIQGTAAEVCKMAMIYLSEDYELRDKYGYRMCLQVHDEIVGECPDESVEVVKARKKEWMEHPFPTDIGVPLLVELGSAKAWGLAK